MLIILFAFFAIGISLAFSLKTVRKSEQSKSNEMTNEPNESKKTEAVDFSKYNKILSRHKITGVEDIEGSYKKVTVNDGQITFSFEVPDKWIAETRNSGEMEMNEDELRDFLATNYDGDIRTAKGYDKVNKSYYPKDSQYSGRNWDQLKNMTYEQLKKEYRRDGTFKFPNATVSRSNYIYYTSGNGYQIDFYIRPISAKDVKRYSQLEMSEDMSSSVSDEGATQKIRIGTKVAELFTAKMNGDIGSDRMEIYVPFTDSAKYLFVHIQGRSFGEFGKFEPGFHHLLETMRFE